MVPARWVSCCDLIGLAGMHFPARKSRCLQMQDRFCQTSVLAKSSRGACTTMLAGTFIMFHHQQHTWPTVRIVSPALLENAEQHCSTGSTGSTGTCAHQNQPYAALHCVACCLLLEHTPSFHAIVVFLQLPHFYNYAPHKLAPPQLHIAACRCLAPHGCSPTTTRPLQRVRPAVHDARGGRSAQHVQSAATWW